MAKIDNEQMADAVGRVMEARTITNRETRQRVVAHASRIIDLLTGKTDQASVIAPPYSLDEVISDAPEGIPAVTYKSTLMYETADHDAYVVDVISDLGSYFAKQFSDERPSNAFNAAFYAGVVAARDGLVDVSLFHHDSELRAKAAEPETNES
ncbi:MAG TPA: hypothetical protein VG992_00490 [Candidatus Saccharimonadales bacterium]|nr:hypothetical protein [Candidatus Saccharimonadales bacterium]